MTYSTNRASVDVLVAKLAESHPGCKTAAYKLELTSNEDITQVAAKVEQDFGRHVDILVANAGYGRRITDVEQIPIDEFDKMISINLRASFLLVQAFVGDMRRQQWGRIVFVSSVAAYGAGINGCRECGP